MTVPIAALQWYRLQCYAWYRFSAIVNIACFSEKEIKECGETVVESSDAYGPVTLYKLKFGHTYTLDGVEFTPTYANFGDKISVRNGEIIYAKSDFTQPQANALEESKLVYDVIEKFCSEQNVKYSNISPTLKDIMESLKSFQSDAVMKGPNTNFEDEIKARLNEIDKLIKQPSRTKVSWKVVAAVLVMLLSLVGYYVYEEWYYTAERAFLNEDYLVAHEKGHIDGAYCYAQQLEKNGQLEAAASWYQKSIANYENYFAACDTIDEVRTYRLLHLLITVKGGVYSPAKILKYAEQVKEFPNGKGLYILACIFSNEEELIENEWKYAVRQKDILEGSDVYLGLVSIFYYLTDHKNSVIKNREEFFELRDKLARNKEILPLLNFILCEAALSGNTTQGIDPFTVGIQVLTENAIRYNDIRSQLLSADVYNRIGLFSQSDSLTKMATRNGCKEALLYLWKNKVGMMDFRSADSIQQVMNTIKSFPLAAKLLVNSNGREPIQKIDYLKKAQGEMYSNNVYVNESVLFDNICMNYLKADQLDSLALSNRNYLRAVQYFEGIGGHEKDAAKADSLLNSAIQEGDFSARYTKGILAFEQNDFLGAMKQLVGLADSCSAAANLLSFIYEDIDTSKSQYYLQKGKNSSDLYFMLKQIEKWKFDIWSEQRHFPLNEVNENIAKLEQALCRNLYTDDPSLVYLSSELAVLYHILGVQSASELHAKIAFEGSLRNMASSGSLEMQRSHWCLLQLAQMYTEKGENPVEENMQLAQQCLERFCLIHFMYKSFAENSMNKKLAIEAVRLIRNHFPLLESALKQKLGYDFSAEISDDMLQKTPKMLYNVRYVPYYRKYKFNLK